MEKKFNNKPNKSIINDGNEYWISRSCAVVGMVFTIENNEKYVLCVKRGEGAADFKGFYCLPCGYMDYNETAYNAFRREVFEETGFFIEEEQEDKQPYYVNSDPKSNKQNISLYFNYFVGNKDLIELTDENSEKDEIAGIEWINIKEIDFYSFCFNHENRIKEFFNLK